MKRRSDERKADRAAESSLARGLRVIETLTEGSEMSLGEIASQSGIPKPTTHRLLRIMAQHGWAEQSENGSYGIGPQALKVGGLSLRSVAVARRATAGLVALRRETPETIHLAVRRGHVAVYIDKVDGSTPYQMASRIGKSILLYPTAIGKAILAFVDDEVLDDYLATVTLEPRTPRTISQPDSLRANLVKVRSAGFAIDDEEHEDLIRCVGAPIFDARGVVVGGVSVSAPIFRLSFDEAVALGPTIVRCAETVSRACGARPEDLPAAWGVSNDGLDGSANS